ncbi:uncharacterized protein BJX67DRAFT_42258 [Aspergillus lucknowensis]|uniref:Uncharacterized protein n=1 Tax=Aspergillus lucknowensis TaxID=176173 RepID=A0ABR4LVC5_9EURO
MPSASCPSEVLENNKPLFGSSEMNASPLQYLTHSRHELRSYSHSAIRRRNYYSDTTLWICCGCGDGPKVYHHQTVCVICQHVSCPDCTLVK